MKHITTIGTALLALLLMTGCAGHNGSILGGAIGGGAGAALGGPLGGAIGGGVGAAVGGHHD